MNKIKSKYYSIRELMSYDRNLYTFRLIIGARGIGKSYSIQNLFCNFYHKVKHIPEDPNNIDDLFIMARLTNRAVDNMVDRILDSKLIKKHKIIPSVVTEEKRRKIYFNDRHMGDIISLADAPVIKGGSWEWQRYKYVFLDEFQREKNEKRMFNVDYNLRSILESMCRFSTRLNSGMDLPIVLGAANTVDEATDLLYAFDFMPINFGMYKLRAKNAIIHYAANSAEYDAIQRRNPLRHLARLDDFTFGERKLKDELRVINPENVGHKKFIAFLHLTPYVRLEVWQSQKGYLYVTKDHPTRKNVSTHFVIHKWGANRGAIYSLDFHMLIRKHYESNNIAFDKRITAVVFNQHLV